MAPNLRARQSGVLVFLEPEVGSAGAEGEFGTWRRREPGRLQSTDAELTIGEPQEDHRDVEDFELIAQELSGLAEKVRSLEDRLVEVERVNARLEDAALTTARALGEVSRHWDAVYDAMRREEIVDTDED